MSHNSFHSISSLSFFPFHIFTLFFSIPYLHSLFFHSISSLSFFRFFRFHIFTLFFSIPYLHSLFFNSISSLSFFRFHIFTLFFSISYLHSLFFDSVILGVRRRGRTHRSSTQVRTSSLSNITISVDQNFDNFPDLIFFAHSYVIVRRKIIYLIQFIWCCNYIDFLIILS